MTVLICPYPTQTPKDILHLNGPELDGLADGPGTGLGSRELAHLVGMLGYVQTKF